MNTTIPTHHVGLTAEELKRRARIAELRETIKEFASLRRAIKDIYRLNHASSEFAEERKNFMTWEKFSWLTRDTLRPEITKLHVELAALRGKVHLKS